MHASFQRSKHCLQVYIRIDQPQTALEQYSQAASRQEGQIDLLLGQARVYDALNDLEQGVKLYKQVIHLYKFKTIDRHVQCTAALHADACMLIATLAHPMLCKQCRRRDVILCRYLNMTLAMWKP